MIQTDEYTYDVKLATVRVDSKQSSGGSWYELRFYNKNGYMVKSEFDNFGNPGIITSRYEY